MAVGDFISLSEAKQTVEKEVHRKPSIAELTKVEVPGKPSPALFLEDNNGKRGKKTRRKKKFEKSEQVKASKPAKDSILIITEKPQAAIKIANALGKARKLGETGVSYYELEKDGRKILVASAVGHLYSLTYKQGQSGWPVFELEWQP